jgi:hypothetical protein
VAEDLGVAESGQVVALGVAGAVRVADLVQGWINPWC